MIRALIFLAFLVGMLSVNMLITDLVNHENVRRALIHQPPITMTLVYLGETIVTLLVLLGILNYDR